MYNIQSLIFDLGGGGVSTQDEAFCVNYPDIPIYRPIYNQPHLLPTHQQHYPNRLYSSTSPVTNDEKAKNTEKKLNSTNKLKFR